MIKLTLFFAIGCDINIDNSAIIYFDYHTWYPFENSESLYNCKYDFFCCIYCSQSLRVFGKYIVWQLKGNWMESFWWNGSAIIVAV